MTLTTLIDILLNSLFMVKYKIQEHINCLIMEIFPRGQWHGHDGEMMQIAKQYLGGHNFIKDLLGDDFKQINLC